MQQSEEKYRSLVEASPDAVLMLDLGEEHHLCFPRVAELFGYDSVEELCTQKVTGLRCRRRTCSG